MENYIPDVKFFSMNALAGRQRYQLNQRFVYELDPHGCLHRSVIYGTASFVTGAFGLAMASWVVRNIAQPKQQAAIPVQKTENIERSLEVLQ